MAVDPGVNNECLKSFNLSVRKEKKKKAPSCLYLSSFVPLLCDSGLVIAMLVSMLFLLLLRFTAPVMVWVLIIGLLGAGAYGKFYPLRKMIS